MAKSLEGANPKRPQRGLPPPAIVWPTGAHSGYHTAHGPPYGDGEITAAAARALASRSTVCVVTDRHEYVLADDGWDAETRLAAARQALALIRDAITTAETDIPWHQRDRWPADVVSAAELLRDRFVPPEKQVDDYAQTEQQRTIDEETLDAFLTFAPFAYDSTFWADAREVAGLSDEGTSLVIALTDEERRQLADALGADRVISLREWRDRHPSALRRLARRLKLRP